MAVACFSLNFPWLNFFNIEKPDAIFVPLDRDQERKNWKPSTFDLKYLRKPQTAEDLTNKIVDSFCKLELTDLSFHTGSEKLNYLKKIFGVTNETEDTMERDSVDHIHQWFNNVAERVREKSGGQIVCEIASPSCKFPNLVEVPYDFRFQIFKANEGDSPSSPYLLVQLAPFGAGWYCHRLQN